MRSILFVASDGENVLWDRLSQFFEKTTSLRIASAFLGAGDEIISWVNQGSERRVEIIVRLEYPTNPGSVAALHKHPRIGIRAADAAGMPFHEKLFLAIDSTGECVGAYIGSANWTQGGLRRNREAGVWVRDRDILQQMEGHFIAGYQTASEISAQMLAELQSDLRWHESHRKRPEKDRGTLISSWPDLKLCKGRTFLVKQNGISARPFVEGEHEFCELTRNQSSQTLSKIPATFEHGFGIVITRIARRGNGSPDRVIYGRGRIAGFNIERWRLPEPYLAALGQRGVDPEKIQYMRRWPEVLWLDPAENIDYPRGVDGLVWLSDYMDGPSFQGGFRWIPADVRKACNRALDERTEKFGLLPLDRQGIWWNQHVGITEPTDPLFMTKARIEEMCS